MGARCAARGHKVFLLGGRPAVMQRALAAVRRQAPSLQIAGSRHGFYEKTGADNDAIVAEINDAATNIMLVGFGMPIQERWVLEHADRPAVIVLLVVGRFFDPQSGEVPPSQRCWPDCGRAWLSLRVPPTP